jgi:hypothetical protein
MSATYAPSALAFVSGVPPARPGALLVDVSPSVRDALLPALRAVGLEVRETSSISDPPPGTVLAIVEADRAGRMLDTVRRVRGLLNGALVAGVVGWWSEEETDLTRVADAALHVPLRRDQLDLLLDALARRLDRPAACAAL